MKIKPIQIKRYYDKVEIPSELDCIEFRLVWCEFKLHSAMMFNCIVGPVREYIMLEKLNKNSGGDSAKAIEMIKYSISSELKGVVYNIEAHKVYQSQILDKI